MSKQALLISVRPRFAQMIFDGSKTVELRRVRPRVGKGDLVFVYVSSPVKALEGVFEIDEVACTSPNAVWHRFGKKTALSKHEFETYYEGTQEAYAIAVARYWRLSSPVELAALKKQQKDFYPPRVITTSLSRISHIRWALFFPHLFLRRNQNRHELVCF